MRITILIGTMTGTAQLVAQEIELAHGDDATRIEAKMMDGLDAAALAGGGVFLVCTSTYGEGDVPDNAKALYASLTQSDTNLANVRYGVIGLGDRTYASTFCFGGRKFDAALAACGARRIGEPLFHDASAGTLPEELALQWAEHWLALVRADNAEETS